ncbi:sensor histidine kinase [Halioxenophilus sp. WMMB6]|uniref:sensor histidine kinase n=1 Tax=Halioxenophilus sp. WMMB6 TaxID=3073815 RepID=UPI00295F1DEE|nr:ATP-binding protein [Halioxenophilus sp. WMMB6]
MVKPAAKQPGKITRNNRLLLRYYAGIILGIVLLAFSLDLAFFYFGKKHSEAAEFSALFQLAQALAELTETAPSPSTRGANSATAHSPVAPYQLQLLPLAAIQLRSDSLAQNGYTLVSEGDGQYFLYGFSRDQKNIVRFGPVSPHAEQMDWSGWVFYGALVILMGLWLRPLLKDLDRISQAVSDFRENYRAPLPQLKQSSNLKPLANNIARMAERIRQLIDTQRDLSNVLSHEMRTPLARIKFSLALLRSQPTLPPEQLCELQGIDNDVVELEQLTQAMLNFAKLEHPDMAIDRQWLPAGTWLESCTEKQQRQRPEITLQLRVSEPGALIFIDRYWFELALSNLINNALRYAREQLELQLTIGEHGCSVQIADDGPGIPEAELTMVTKPFYQAGSSDRQSQNKGFGLGLALVRRIAQLHGGELRVGSSRLGGALLEVTAEW